MVSTIRRGTGSRGRPRLERQWALEQEQRYLLAWRALCFLFLAAGAINAALTAIVAVPDGNAWWLYALSVAAVVVGTIGLRHPARSPALIEALMICGLVMVSCAVVLSDDGSSPWVVFYAWVGVESALLLGVSSAVRVNVLSAAAYAVASAVVATPAPGMFVMTIGSMLVLAALAWTLRLYVDRLIARLHEAARIDSLTGLLGRRGYQESIATELGTARRRGTVLSVVLGDLDEFKAFNVRHGHERGDDALRIFADVCREVSRSSDIAARTGAKQFVLVLPGADADAAAAVAERLRLTLSARLDQQGMPATASFGIATYPDHGRSADSLLDAADQARAVAKAQGRDQVVVFSAAAAERLRVRDGRPGESAEQLDAVLLLAEALDLRDPSTARHSQTVGAYAEQTAGQLGLPEAEVQRVRLAGLLHDIGKIGVSDAVLHKPGKLTAEEFAEIKRHAEIGGRILARAGLPDISRWVLAHHERPDGKGYPRGLRGEAIPLQSRILSVCDAFEAMTAERVYSPAMSAAAAAAELRRGAGRQFDGQIVDAFLAALTWPGGLEGSPLVDTIGDRT